MHETSDFAISDLCVIRYGCFDTISCLVSSDCILLGLRRCTLTLKRTHSHAHNTSVWQPKSSKKHVIKQHSTVSALDRTGHVSRDDGGGVLGEEVQGGKRRCKEERKEEGKKFEELEERFKRREQGHPSQAIHLPVCALLCMHPSLSDALLCQLCLPTWLYVCMYGYVVVSLGARCC